MYLQSTTGVGAGTETPNLSQTPFGLGGLGGLAGLGNLGMGSHNFMEMQQNMQREVSYLRTYQWWYIEWITYSSWWITILKIFWNCNQCVFTF